MLMGLIHDPLTLEGRISNPNPMLMSDDWGNSRSESAIFINQLHSPPSFQLQALALMFHSHTPLRMSPEDDISSIQMPNFLCTLMLSVRNISRNKAIWQDLPTSD